MSNNFPSAAIGDFSASGDATTRVVKTLTMTPEADQLLAELARRSSLSEGDVLRLALGMFWVASDAKQQGKHVGVAQDADNLDVEIVGF